MSDIELLVHAEKNNHDITLETEKIIQELIINLNLI